MRITFFLLLSGRHSLRRGSTANLGDSQVFRSFSPSHLLIRKLSLALFVYVQVYRSPLLGYNHPVSSSPSPRPLPNIRFGFHPISSPSLLRRLLLFGVRSDSVLAPTITLRPRKTMAITVHYKFSNAVLFPRKYFLKTMRNGATSHSLGS